MNKKYRLVTRSDMDGLVCAVLLKHLDLIDDIKFVHPKDMQDGKIEITENDICTNVPYVESAHIVFDHHLSETIRNNFHDNHISCLPIVDEDNKPIGIITWRDIIKIIALQYRQKLKTSNVT